MTVKWAWWRPLRYSRRVWIAIFVGGVILWSGFSEYSNAMDSSGKLNNESKESKKAQTPWGHGRAYIQSQKAIAYTLADEMASFEGLAQDAPVVAGDTLAAGPQSFTLIGDDGIELAEVMPGTPLTVVRDSGSSVEVEIRGWALKAYPVALVTAVGQRILYAKLSEAGVETRQSMQEAEDDYGELWQETKITGLAKKAVLVRDVSVVWELAEKFYVMKCGVCHSPHSSMEYPAYQWPGIINVMDDYSNLSTEGRNLMRAYLQLHASDMVEPDVLLAQTAADKKIPTAASVPYFQGYEGAPLFSVVSREDKLPLLPCEQCHQPDPPKLENLTELMALHPNPVEIYHGEGRMWCLVCHKSKESDFLRTLRDEKVRFDDSYLVCGQCHNDQQKDWYFGGHGKRVANWRGKRTLYNCTYCHDPHDPSIKPRKAQPPPPVRAGLRKMKKSDNAKTGIWERYLNKTQAGSRE